MSTDTEIFFVGFIGGQLGADRFTEAEWGRICDAERGGAHMVAVNFRVRRGHSAFTLRTIFDRRGLSDDELLLEGRKHARKIIQDLNTATADWPDP